MQEIRIPTDLPTCCEFGGKDLDILYFTDPVVPLAPIAEERVQMALPMKPLCKTDCLG